MTCRDQAVVGVVEGRGDGADDLEPERLPQVHRRGCLMIMIQTVPRGRLEGGLGGRREQVKMQKPGLGAQAGRCPAPQGGRGVTGQ